jgi:hypothetical protein
MTPSLVLTGAMGWGAAGGRQREADLGKHGALGRRRWRHVAEAACGVPKDRERLEEEVGAGEVAGERWRGGVSTLQEAAVHDA